MDGKIFLNCTVKTPKETKNWQIPVDTRRVDLYSIEELKEYIAEGLAFDDDFLEFEPEEIRCTKIRLVKDREIWSVK